MILRTCDWCGCNIDPGEICDCRKEEAAAAGTATTSWSAERHPISNIIAPPFGFVKDSPAASRVSYPARK